MNNSDASKFKPVRKAVFPVAGLGTRLVPATKVVPKELLTLLDRPLIEHAVEEALDAGIEQIILVTSPGKDAIAEHFDHKPTLENLLESGGKEEELYRLKASTLKPGRLQTVRQSVPLGLGHAVWTARHLIGDEPFAVLLVDDAFLAKPGIMTQLMDVYDQNGGNVVGVLDVPREHTKFYGVADVQSDDGCLITMNNIVEKPEPATAPSTLSVIGRYILQPEVFTHLENLPAGAGGEIQLTDAMAIMLKEQAFTGVRIEGQRFDCGRRMGYLEASIAFALADPDLGPHVKKLVQKYSS